MPTLQFLTVANRRFVVLEESEYERLCKRAGIEIADADLPPLPKPDKHGHFPALEYARASMARSLIRDRKAAGLSQHQLAKLAGVRQETISRLESAKHSASVRVVERIDSALRRATK